MAKVNRIHNHTDSSDMRLKDSNLFLKDLLDYSHEKGIDMVAITEHECLCDHVKAMRMREQYPDMKIALGNEIYLLDREEHDRLKEAKEKIKYYHFILLAKNKAGHECLRRLSSEAWEDMYFYRMMERVPTFKDRLEYYLNLPEYKGTIIGSTACLGGELGTLILEDKDYKPFIEWCLNLFGEDFYLEMQPSHNEEQIKVNKKILEISEEYNIPYTISTDSHYKNLDSQKEHWNFLQSQDGDREVEDFYAYTYIMGDEELLEFFPKEIIDKANEYGEDLYNKIEEYDLFHSPILPPVFIPDNFDKDWVSMFAGRFDLPYTQKYLNSPHKEDRYYLYLIEQGYKARGGKHGEEKEFKRINVELEQCWELSKNLGQHISKYHLAIQQILEIIWEISLIGPARGSASCFYLNYLIDLVQVNPLDYDLPYWRYMEKDKVELSDFDFDTESSKRELIVEKMREVYGDDRVLSFCTFSTEGSKSIVMSCCRGMDIDKEIAENMKNLIPVIRGSAYTIEQMLYGDEKEDIKPNKEFIKMVDSFPGLREALLKNAKLIKGRSQHASGVLILPEPYWKHNALMKTKKGIKVTQFDAHDSEDCSGVKIDFLTVEALDRLRTVFDVLIKDGKIAWEGSLKATWNKHFHPRVLDIVSEEIYEPLYKLTISNAFQFTSAIGMNALAKLKAETFKDVYNANSLMRLKEVDGKNPLERYIRFRNDMSQWYKEMKEYGLTEAEIRDMYELFKDDYGVMSNQETLMLSSMKICGYSVKEANSLRKSISKKDEEKQKKEKKKLFKRGIENGRSEKFMQYYWDYQIAFSLGYAFSVPHTIAYSYILLQELNMFIKYGKEYWDLGNLLIDSGLVGDMEKNTNYDKLTRATGKLDNIIPCDINKSDMDFKVEGDKIRYGFRAISGLDKATFPIIEKFRPYKSFDDFLDKIYYSKKLKEKKIITLIKTGAFDCFEKDRRKLMIDFVSKAIPVRKSLTMTQFPIVREHIKGFEKEKEIYDFRNKIIGKNKIPMNKQIEQEFLSLYSDCVDFTINDKGVLVIDTNSFDKVYEARVQPLKDKLKELEVRELFATIKRREMWANNCLGNVSSWEMEVYYTYFSGHELDLMPIGEYFNLSNFEKLGDEPVVDHYYRKKLKDRTIDIPIYQLERIAGTVIGKDNQRHYVYLLTKDGVVSVKYQKGQFAHYTSKHENDGSWFERGTILVVTGYRKGIDFIAKSYNNGNSTTKIVAYNNKALKIQSKKIA